MDSTTGTRPGPVGDELGFLSAWWHLALGYVGQPPLTPLLTRVTTALTGGTLAGFRILPALGLAALVAMTTAMGQLVRLPGPCVVRAWCAAGPGAQVPYLVMRPAVMRRTKPSSEAEQRYKADVALAGRRAELLDAAREAEDRFRRAQARRAPDEDLRRLAEGLDAALTEAMRAAYAAQRAEIGPRGYDDRIYRRKARATPRVHALTAEAERLLTLRETHRLNDIPAVPYDPAL